MPSRPRAAIVAHVFRARNGRVCSRPYSANVPTVRAGVLAQVGRDDAERVAQVVGAAHQRAAGVDRDAEPLVRVERQRVGALHTPVARGQRRIEHAEGAVGTVDVEPEPLGGGDFARARRAGRSRRCSRFPPSPPAARASRRPPGRQRSRRAARPRRDARPAAAPAGWSPSRARAARARAARSCAPRRARRQRGAGRPRARPGARRAPRRPRRGRGRRPGRRSSPRMPRWSGARRPARAGTRPAPPASARPCARGERRRGRPHTTLGFIAAAVSDASTPASAGGELTQPKKAGCPLPIACGSTSRVIVLPAPRARSARPAAAGRAAPRADRRAAAARPALPAAPRGGRRPRRSARGRYAGTRPGRRCRAAGSGSLTPAA